MALTSPCPPHRPKRHSSPSMLLHFSPTNLLLLIISLSLLLLLVLNSPKASTTQPRTFSGDLREAEFSWNTIPFSPQFPPPILLRIAVFTRKWPTLSIPGGMERHALTLHSALSLRGHKIDIFTSQSPNSSTPFPTNPDIKIHYLSTPHWRCDEAIALFNSINNDSPFDVIHSESVAIYHRFADRFPNLAVTWHGISYEALQSGIYQDLARQRDDPISPLFNRSLGESVFKLLDEVRFFGKYSHHVAISNSMGEVLRDVYQIPSKRVHVILNGVDELHFSPDLQLGLQFRREFKLPENALVMGVAGRLVKDKGHPLLYLAFKKLSLQHPNVFLVVAGSGPWADRYRGIGPNVLVLGPVAPARLKAFYGALDVFLDPTLRPQGLDLTLMEAMQCGTPVVATRFPSIKGSVVVDEEFGFTFAPNVDALVEVLERVVEEGRERLARRRMACREYAKDMFSATKMALAYERLFLCIQDEKYCRYP